MYARTERRLGIAAALALTLAAFVMPGSINHVVAQDASVQLPGIERPAETLQLAAFSEAAASAVRYK